MATLSIPIVPIQDEKMLEMLLKGAGVPVDQWGTPGVKRVSDLFDELKKGEALLRVSEEGKLERVTRVVRAKVTHGGKHLFEDRQVFHDPTRGERRRNLHVLSEKQLPKEDLLDTLRRLLKEELGIATLPDLTSFGLVEEIKESGSYPGLATRYEFYDYEVELAESQFNPDGYVERDEEKTTYFVWV